LSKRFFKFIPSVFWIYFLPMVVSTLGILDSKSPLYSHMTNYLLPMSLFLLLVSVDLRILKKLGLPGFFVFGAGSLGIVAGSAIVFFLFKGIVGEEFWSGFGALSASWTGGSANMIAVKEALAAPDAVFLPMVVVDTIVPYTWMGGLIGLSAYQGKLDQLNHSRREILDAFESRFKNISFARQTKGNIFSAFGVIVLAAVVMAAAWKVSRWVPVIPGAITAFTWVIILVSTIGLAGSLTPLKRIESFDSTRIGYFILYFVLTTIGARTTIEHFGDALILIAAGFLIVLIHALFLIVAVRIMRCPVFLAAAASQANVGGVASAPIVAEIYQPGLSAVGLLMAIVGNILGTYLGILTGYLCRWIAVVT
jgi:uncharacterized membrane protein